MPAYYIFNFLSTLQVIETLLFSTFVSWKTFFPLVRDDSNCTYTFITGDLTHLSLLAAKPLSDVVLAVRVYM